MASKLNMKVLWTAIVAITCCSMTPSKAQSISAYPSRIFFQAGPGQSEVQSVHITNEGSTPLLMDLQIKDWLRDSLGEKVYFPAATQPMSNAKWIALQPSQLQIAPGETKELTVRLSAPLKGASVTNSMLFITQINEQQPVYKKDATGRTMGIVFRVEVGIHLYNTFPQVSPNKDLEFEQFQERGVRNDSTRQFALKILNKSQGICDAKLKLQLTNKTTGQQYNLPEKAISMLPGSEQTVFSDISAKLPQGHYQLIAILDAGESSALKVAKKEISYE
ncbi:MAG TPA: hypothetical protein VL053_16920 [Arachidicoccus sp.]|nr:hypothetical protein [Arachidicoccus sp.]